MSRDFCVVRSIDEAATWVQLGRLSWLAVGDGVHVGFEIDFVFAAARRTEEWHICFSR